MNHILRQRSHRRIALAVVALLLLVGVFFSIRVTVAQASNPPGLCDKSEDGMEKPSSTGIWYICKYDPVLNGMYWIPKVKQASLLANANSKWVSAELGYGGDLYGMLRGRADVADGWEEFDLTNFSDGTWGIYSLANGLFSSAELGYTGDLYGMLRARATDPNGWERYYLYDLDSGGPYVFQSVGAVEITSQPRSATVGVTMQCSGPGQVPSATGRSIG